MSRDETITRFVKDTLGCKCPDEVFNRIELTHPSNIDTPIDVKMIIGGRLLIYIAKSVNTSSPELLLEELFHAGITERNGSGLNRFRLVIATDNPAAANEILTPKFESLYQKDEKVHLHLVDLSDPLVSLLLK